MNNDRVIDVYVSMWGRDFDIEGYVRSPTAMPGGVLTRRHIGPPIDDNPPTYWRSDKHSATRADLPDQLEALLSKLQASDPARWGGNVSIQIVDKAVTNDDRGGYYLNHRVIGLLAKIGGDIDIDVMSGNLA
jgi:hypothetical protein